MDRMVYYESNGVQLLAPILPEFAHILTVEALDLVAGLTRRYRPQWRELLESRKSRQRLIDAVGLPGFCPGTQGLRSSEWRVAEIPAYLRDRTVEVVCPAGNKKMLLGALNAKKDGAPITLGDLEDANTCNWGPGGTVDGIKNLGLAARGSLNFEHPSKGVQVLDDDYGWLMVRPRGLHFTEPRVLVDGEETPAFIFDVALHLYHNGRALAERGQGADLYLAKLEHGSEAQWCDSVIWTTEVHCGLRLNSTKVSVLFEHILGVFQIEEIIFALRNRFVAGNTGWLDYLASLSRTMRHHDDYVMPDPGQVTVNTPCMSAYLDLVVSKCHQRGAMAIGGTATQVAVPGDDEATQQARLRVLDNAAPYIQKGFDGGWVVYAPFAPDVARYFKSAFVMGHTNQMFRDRLDVNVTRGQLLEPPPGVITPDGLAECIEGGVSYQAGWLTGTGAVAITYRTGDGILKARLMEDAATAERKREDVWKWLSVGAHFSDGHLISHEVVRLAFLAFRGRKLSEVGASEYYRTGYPEAEDAFWKQVMSDSPPDYFPPVLLAEVIRSEAKSFG